MTIVTIILLLLYGSLLDNHSNYFDEINQNLSLQRTICLDNKTHSDDIKDLLLRNHYVQAESDAVFIANTIANRFRERSQIGSLFDLNKNYWKASIEEVEKSGGLFHKASYEKMCSELEQDEISLYPSSSKELSETNIEDQCRGEIKVYVFKKQEDASPLFKILKRDKMPCSGVMVRLKEHHYDEATKTLSEIPIAILRTNEDGYVIFKGLNEEASYSVLPINVGYKYGSAKGTTKATLKDYNKGKMEVSFQQSPMTIPLLESKIIRQIKEDNAFIVRTPADFKESLSKNFFLIVFIWWGIVLLLKMFRRNIDTIIVSALMGLTGLCILMMYSLNNPLTDVMLGEEMFPGIIVGCILLFFVQFINPIAFYQDRLIIRFDYLSSKLGWAKGFGFLVLGLLLTLLLFTPLGSEVGGMKVNLNFLGIKFQPSEVTKYLIVMFMSAYFCQNAEKIMLYSNSGSTSLLQHKLRSMIGMISGFLFLMFIYILLQDLGPAMVVSFTFIILYSIIKSKVDLKGLDSDNAETQALTIYNFLTCDFALLVYGVVSFVICLYVGNLFNVRWLGAILWFAVWTLGGWKKHKVIESPILFNLIISAFVFGSSLQNIPISTFEKVGKRLEARSAMCTNTWGVLSETEQIPTENSQVVDGLWGLATGGLNGQGLSKGECTLIPAFNTDMIVESIGTQLGFWGILFVMLLYCVLLRRSIIVGFKSYHPFSFYLCMGIAIVTGVQLLIIVLGSTGVIPLTGVAVPFLSYGKVSMILNLFAFGWVLAVSHYGNKSSLDHSSVYKYNAPIILLTGTFLVLMLFVCGTFFKYQVIDRNKTLTRPLFVKTDNSSPIVKYNPRIQLLTKNMRMGDIYDRNGVILATSDKRKLRNHVATKDCKLELDTIKRQSRYYPFGEHLFFMVGDYNTKLFFNTHDQRGYLAEDRHLDSLRGYSNIKKDRQGRSIKIDIHPVKVSVGRFAHGVVETDTIKNFALRDYRDLLPYLKAGIQSERVRDYNSDDESWWSLGKIKPNDLHLTVDAVLQTRLQQGIEEHMKKNLSASKYNKVRASVVVLDANRGDLLASAVYPLPDYDILLNLSSEELNRYSDYYKDSQWKAYTDMDLGLSYSTAPGSTAKVMSAMAGFMKEGNSISRQTYNIHPQEKIYPNEAVGNLDMKWALRYSSNCYFINLVNDKNLYNELAEIYGNVGIQIYDKRPYALYHQVPSEGWKSGVLTQESVCLSAYEKYLENRDTNKQKMNNKTGKPDAWSWAWGQNDIYATPASMARVISIVANDGKMPVTKYLMDSRRESIELIKSSSSDILKEHLSFTAKEHDKFDVSLSSRLGGKTGTPERTWKESRKKVYNDFNDGWYICFIERADIDHDNKNKDCLAIAVRIERLNDSGSGRAVGMTKDVVIKTLQELKYI